MEFKAKLRAAGENPFVAWRKRHGLTKGDLARLLDVSYATVYKLESGHYATQLTDKLRFKIYEAGLPPDIFGAYVLWRNGLPWEQRFPLTGDRQEPDPPPKK
ncbi:MAG: helix-turn-helix transcriptional regulator [Desulfotomaculales bacterium]